MAAIFARSPGCTLTKLFTSRITQVFRLGFNSPLASLKSAHHNLEGALQYPTVVEEYIAQEVTQHRIIDPLPKSAVPRAHVSHFGVIPKIHSPHDSKSARILNNLGADQTLKGRQVSISSSSLPKDDGQQGELVEGGRRI